MHCDPVLVKDLFKRARKIRALVFDIDGVFANSSIVYNSVGEESKYYNALDGFGIKLARTAQLITGVISARESQAIRVRAAELSISNLYLGRFDKLNAYQALKADLSLQDEEICFIGDDMPDLPVLKCAGLPVAVNNASARVKQAIAFHTRKDGGDGAVREVVDLILFAQGRLKATIDKFYATV